MCQVIISYSTTGSTSLGNISVTQAPTSNLNINYELVLSWDDSYEDELYVGNQTFLSGSIVPIVYDYRPSGIDDNSWNTSTRSMTATVRPTYDDVYVYQVVMDPD